jgi:hypothetical protein
VFNTHTQAGGTASVQSAQMRQIKDFIYRSLIFVSNEYAIPSIRYCDIQLTPLLTLSSSVILVGDLNVNEFGVANNSLSYKSMMELLGNPRDLFKVLHHHMIHQH